MNVCETNKQTNKQKKRKQANTNNLFMIHVLFSPAFEKTSEIHCHNQVEAVIIKYWSTFLMAFRSFGYFISFFPGEQSYICSCSCCTNLFFSFPFYSFPLPFLSFYLFSFLSCRLVSFSVASLTLFCFHLLFSIFERGFNFFFTQEVLILKQQVLTCYFVFGSKPQLLPEGRLRNPHF